MTALSRTQKIQWIITLALTAACFFIPEGGIVTYQLKMFLVVSVFCLALAAFELISLMFIAIMIPALYALFKVADAAVIMAPWTSTTMLLMVGAIFMSQSLEESGLLRRIAF